MNLIWFAHIIVHHPYVILSAIAVFSGTCILIPFTLRTKPFPNFSDPQMGFSTRGTIISNRLTAWQNLVKATKPSGTLTINPKDIFIPKSNTTNIYTKIKQDIYNNNNNISKNKKNKFDRTIKTFSPINNSDIVIHSQVSGRSDSTSSKRWKDLERLGYPTNKPNMNVPSTQKPLQYDFCGAPDEKYVHIVAKSTTGKNLLTLDSLISLCGIEQELIQAPYYEDLCIVNDERCCKPWSLANYIAVLHKKPSCLAITKQDINSTLSLLQRCAKYYHNFKLTQNCEERGNCDVPSECFKHDAVYNILNYLTTTSFLPSNNISNGTILLETMIFLPVACSIATIPYYHKIEELNLEYEGISVVGMDFGIKEALFDQYLLHDTWLMGFGILFICFCMWLYTGSLFLTFMTIIAIILSLGISFFMYTLVFELNFFPFMNLLAIIVAIGIGADDAFIFCKILTTIKSESNDSIVKIISDSLRHAFSSMFVTSLTTSVAFFASYVSSVTAICCFSIFAGTSVIINCLLMMSWFPACVVIYESDYNNDRLKNCLMTLIQRCGCSRIINPQWNLSTIKSKFAIITKLWNTKERLLLDIIINFKCLWFILFSVLAIGSAVVVLYYPKLQLPTSTDFQLFDSSHPFETYDFKYKNHFWFNRADKLNTESNINYKLPLRFVWGVLPIDNGDHLNPVSLGSLVLDTSFDISKPESQIFLLKFCKNLRQQPFYYSIFGPLLPNCFIETFVKSMQRNCYDSLSNRNRTPCCKISKFPFRKDVFNECIIEEMMDIYKTPSQYLIPGMAGPKFTNDQYPTIKAVIVEYYSNYSYSMSYEYMHKFYTEVENWMLNVLKTAPKSMKNGWFISDLDFYDLQKELSESTFIAIAMSMGLALIVVLISTLNILTSLYAILTINCSIFVTMAVLILLGWKLNILESVAISTAIGLTVDFSLHYTVNYRLCPLTVGEHRATATRYALTHMAGPSLMAAITTGAAGAFMMPSLILPYIQIGIFLVTVMSVSWIYATFYLGSVLAIAGPEHQFGQFHYSECCSNDDSEETVSNERNQPINSSISETHELDLLTTSTCPAQRPLQRSCSASGSIGGIDSKNNPNKYIFSDQSPSTSAITIIMADDN